MCQVQVAKIVFYMFYHSMQICKNHSYTPNFQALPVAKVITPQEKLTLVLLDKNYDGEALQKLLYSFMDGSIKDTFPNTLQAAMKVFLKNAFESINQKGIKGVLSIMDGMPTGLITYNIDKTQNEIYINSLAAWIPKSLKKIKNNGRMLVRQVYEEALNSGITEVAVVPGFTSLPFYEKLGFKSNGHRTCISYDKIKKQIQSLNKKFIYTKVTDTKPVDLLV